MKKLFGKIKYVLAIALLLVGFSMTTTDAYAAKISMNKTESRIYEDRTVKLALSGVTEGIKWSSRNPEIAKVSKKGKVTGVSEGQTVITAKYNGKKYKCTVTVTKPFINIKEKNVEIDETFKIKVKGATVTKYASSDEQIATVDSTGCVKAVGAGAAVISAETAKGRKFNCYLTVNPHVHTIIVNNGKKPKCTTDGYTDSEYCATCGEELVKSVALRALGHNYENGVCTRCGQAEPISEIHTHTFAVIPAVEPTCTTDGTSECVYCSECETVFLPKKPVAKLGHSLVNGDCTRCGVHVHKELVFPAVAVTCFADGTSEWSMCEYCGEILKPMQTTKAPGEHSFGADGLCVRCGSDKYGHIHDWEILKYVKPSCEDPGLTEGRYCKTCSARLEQQFLMPTGHNFKDGKCTVCGKKETP